MRRLMACLYFSAAALVAAAADRDPTAPPVEAGLAASAPATAGGGAVPQASSVIVKSGKPYLAVGTRLYAVGQKIGNAKLERITETEIWLREGGQLSKVQRFAGIQRSAAKPPVACVGKSAVPSSRAQRKATAAHSPSSPQAVTPLAPCEGAQP